MVISMLNGSPKVDNSNTEQFLNIVEDKLEQSHSIQRFIINKKQLSEEEIYNIMKSNVLIISFPLYVDGIPSHLLQQSITLEEAYKKLQHEKTIVYVVANNGFYEGDQNESAIAMIKNFCKRAGLIWGQGLGIGTGEMLGGMLRTGKIPLGKGPLANLGKGIDKLVYDIEHCISGENIYVTPNLPAFVFKVMAHKTFWDTKAKKNGLKRNDLKRKLTFELEKED